MACPYDHFVAILYHLSDPSFWNNLLFTVLEENDDVSSVYEPDADEVRNY